MNKHELYMQRALQLAQLGGVAVAPNPMVGAVIVHNDRIIGEGYHQLFGKAHAEVRAIENVQDPSLLSESTIYVTLEPCAHTGKTPPCALLLIRSGIQKVIIATIDPYAEVAGKGIEMLQNAGIDVTVGVLEKEAQFLNRRFFTFHQRQRPYTILKWAETKDGFIDAPRTENDSNEIRWISQPETQVINHTWRSQEQVILVGWKTIQNDNPSLTTRAIQGANPIRMVIDPQLKAPTTATVFSDGLPTLVINSVHSAKKGAVEWIQMDTITIASIQKLCYDRGIASLIVEGGSYTHQSFIAENTWDEARVIQGTNQFHDGTPAAKISGLPTEIQSFGQDSIYYYFNTCSN
jgi:diaminohydroxyphosphoribosylaminopyrimidine deaminase/5-amino-6-(5-phosphoribosylamino)uracil reductase